MEQLFMWSILAHFYLNIVVNGSFAFINDTNTHDIVISMRHINQLWSRNLINAQLLRF